MLIAKSIITDAESKARSSAEGANSLAVLKRLQ